MGNKPCLRLLKLSAPSIVSYLIYCMIKVNIRQYHWYITFCAFPILFMFCLKKKNYFKHIKLSFWKHLQAYKHIWINKLAILLTYTPFCLYLIYFSSIVRPRYKLIDTLLNPSWNKPVQSNEWKLSCSRKQRLVSEQIVY